MQPEQNQQKQEEDLQERSQKLAIKINIPENSERRNQLIEKLMILFRNGFDENLFHLMDPKFFVEKGFSISEALLISKDNQSLHPTIEEIQRLKKDDVTNILKLEYIKPNLENTLNYYYILVIGPTNRGKTTVIFNLINSLYNINIDSLYRVKKMQGQQNEYYDEYIIQISNKDCYVFVDFKGIGDVKLDFLGLDLSGKNNLYTTILKYVENKSILSILYVNSSSINRLGYEEHYQLQRFFEILPKSFLNRIYFILTYCTDNQPLLSVYSSKKNEAVPQELKIIMDVEKPELVPKEQRFWFGINNTYLYEKIDYREQKEFKVNNQIDIQAVIDGQEYLNIEIQREEGTTLTSEQQNQQDNNPDEAKEIEIPVEELPKIYYNQMLQITKDILQKIKMQNPILISQNDGQTFQQVLNFEKELIKLLQIKNKQSKQQFPNRVIHGEKKSIYILYQTLQQQSDKNKKEDQKQTKRGTKCLYCMGCMKPCHETCYLKNFSEINENKKFCRKLKDLRQQQNACQLNDIKQLLKLIECKACSKRQKNCTLESHKLEDYIPTGFVESIGKIETQINQEFNELYFQKKKEKNILRLEQISVFKSRRGYLSQVEQILEKHQSLNNQEDRLTKINLQQRTILINAIYEQLCKNQQEENNEYLTKLLDIKEIYNKIAPPPPKIDQTGKLQNSDKLKEQNPQNNDDEVVGEENKANEFDPPADSPLTFKQQGPQRNKQDLSQYIANNNLRRSQLQKQDKNINQQNYDPSPSRRNITDNQSFVMLSGHEQSPLIQRNDSVQ